MIDEQVQMVLGNTILCVGLKTMHSFNTFNPQALWTSFMSVVIPETVNPKCNLYNIKRYPAGYFSQFNPETPFEQWAAVSVRDLHKEPSGLETLAIPAGNYLRYSYSGSPGDFGKTLLHVIHHQLPKLGCRHLENGLQYEQFIMGKRPGDPGFTEDVWIPVEKIE